MFELPKELPDGLYQLLTWPDKRLTEVSVDITEADLPEINKMLRPMVAIMKEYNGVGLSAVQIGVHKRIAVMLTGGIAPQQAKVENITVIINPEIVEKTDYTVRNNEGCLSLPSFSEVIERPAEVTVKFRNLDWTETTAVFEGIEAQCIQHEIDHMNGITQNTKLSLMKQQMYEKKLKKGRKSGKIRV